MVSRVKFSQKFNNSISPCAYCNTYVTPPPCQINMMCQFQSQRLASAYKNRHYQRSELRREGGVNTGKRNSSDLIIGQTRSARTAGTVPERAKSNSPFKMVQKQRDMMRNVPVSPRRTTPSIPRPATSNTARARSPWSGHIYMSEVEAHSHKMKSPRSYIQKGEVGSVDVLYTYRLCNYYRL